MRKSTEEEIKEVTKLVLATRERIKDLIQDGKKVHVIWDFDGVLADSRSDDVFTLMGFDVVRYFAYEERLLFQSPSNGQWLLPIAHNASMHPHFTPDKFTQDIVTARSSFLAMRVQIFCLAWQLPMRWMLFLGHQPKKESYRIILESLKSDQDYIIFCVDDNEKHVKAFQDVSKELEIAERTVGIVSPVIRTYSEEELKKYLDLVMKATGNVPIRVRNPSDDGDGFVVLPNGRDQFREQLLALQSKQTEQGYHFELRNAFVKKFGEVGEGVFKTEEDLEQAMREFIVGLWCH